MTRARHSTIGLRRLGEGGPLPLLMGDAPAPPASGPPLCHDLDDETTRYVLAVRPAFDDMRHATGQIASLLILQASGARGAVPDHPMLSQAAAACRDARDRVFSARPTARAAHHHAHLSRAVSLILEAAERAAKALHRHDDAEVEAILRPLKAGWQEMHHASRALPGFEVVSFSAACCAMHAGPVLTNKDVGG